MKERRLGVGALASMSGKQAELIASGHLFWMLLTASPQLLVERLSAVLCLHLHLLLTGFSFVLLHTGFGASRRNFRRECKGDVL